jgi:hypothetical protein
MAPVPARLASMWVAWQGTRTRWLPPLLLLPACLSLQLQSSTRSDDASFTAPVEDGSRYVSVEGGALSSEESLVRRWKTAADKACDGDYMVLSDASFERRDRGSVKRRVHEGFVRCLAPIEES